MKKLVVIMAVAILMVAATEAVQAAVGFATGVDPMNYTITTWSIRTGWNPSLWKDKTPTDFMFDYPTWTDRYVSASPQYNYARTGTAVITDVFSQADLQAVATAGPGWATMPGCSRPISFWEHGGQFLKQSGGNNSSWADDTYWASNEYGCVGETCSTVVTEFTGSFTWDGEDNYVTGKILADDWAKVYINDTLVYTTDSRAYDGFETFSYADALAPGSNSLKVIVYDTGQSSPTAGPTALQLEIIPGPSSAGLGLHNLQWAIPYMIDNSQTVLGQPQATSPRDNRGLAISPDGRYLYAGYNNGPEVRKLDLTQTGYTAMTIARTTVSRGKAIAVDGQGRVYLAEGGAIKIMDANLAGVQYTITGTGLVTKCEGVAATRESGKLVLYNTERGGPNTLTRWELTESGGQVTNAVRAGLDGDGVITITGASDMRGCAVDSLGRIWIADPLATTGTGKVFRVNSDGAGLVSASVGNPYAIGFNGSEVVVTGGYQRLVTVLNNDLSGTPWTFTIPWVGLELDPDGQGDVGMLSGIAFTPNGGGFYLTNEGGQTANEKSTYGAQDANSGWLAGKYYTDLYNDDNDPILYATFGLINEAKRLPNDTPVTISAAIVSAAWTDVFYIEADDRSSGIRVEKAAHGLTDDNVRADVVGIMKTNSDGERYVQASTAEPAGSGSIRPLGMVNRSLGGGDFAYDPGPPQIGQQGVTGGAGLNNIGLLVQIWGRVTEIESVEPPDVPTWFKIDDGSGVSVKCVVPNGVTIDEDWEYVVVTGASSCEKIGDDLYRLIRVREDSDITPY